MVSLDPTNKGDLVMICLNIFQSCELLKKHRDKVRNTPCDLPIMYLCYDFA